MAPTWQLGYSPCPNDTFIFFALAQGRIDTTPHQFEVSLADVEVLNNRARDNRLDVTKVSASALLHLLGDYRLLRAGGAIGRGCGPLLVSRDFATMAELTGKTIAIPGELTTANLLLQLQGEHRGQRREMVFDQIMPAIARGEVDAGVIIHEGRFTYPAFGLHLVLDLGQWWEHQTGLPLPLGAIIMKRSLGEEAARWLEEKIRESLLYARSNPREAWPYIQAHAQEMEPHIIQQHIDMFVNDFSLDAGEEGAAAIEFLLQAAAQQQGLTLARDSIFATPSPISDPQKSEKP